MFGILALMVIASIMIAGCVQPSGNETATPGTTPGITGTPTGTEEETPAATETTAAVTTETPVETGATTTTAAVGVTETPPGTPAVAAVADETISITDSGFVPDALTIPADTTVEWTNDASANQTVSATGISGFFDSGILQPGDTYSYTFSAEGNYTYQSWISGFNGTIFVTP